MKAKKAQELFNIGFDFITEGKWSQAIEAISKGLCLDPNNAPAIGNRCSCYAMLDQFEDALADANRYIELKPDDWHGYWNHGNILSEMGRKDEANESYKTAAAKFKSKAESD